VSPAINPTRYISSTGLYGIKLIQCFMSLTMSFTCISRKDRVGLGYSLPSISNQGRNSAPVCYVMLCHVMSCYVMLCYVMLCYVMLSYVMLSYVMLSYVMLCHVMLCYVILCDVMQFYVMLCNFM
jgi:hypothetical protein